MLEPEAVSAILRLSELGWGSKRISRELGISRNSVREYIAAGGWTPYRQPERKKALDGLDAWLRERFRRHRGNADVLRQELAVEKALCVSLRTVERAVQPFRQTRSISGEIALISTAWRRAWCYGGRHSVRFHRLRWNGRQGRIVDSSKMAKKVPHATDKHVGSRLRMRRMMLGMSQEKLGNALDLTFQQVQKYEKGINRIGASRLQHISHILQVPVAFFFEGAPHLQGQPDGMKEASSPAYVSDFLATSEGLALTKAFMRLKDAKLRRRIVDLVKEIAGDEER